MTIQTVPFAYPPEDFEVNDARILRAIRTPGVEGTAVFARTAKDWTRVVVTITGEAEPMRIAHASLPMEAQDKGCARGKAVKPNPKKQPDAAEPSTLQWSHQLAGAGARGH